MKCGGEANDVKVLIDLEKLLSASGENSADMCRLVDLHLHRQPYTAQELQEIFDIDSSSYAKLYPAHNQGGDYSGDFRGNLIMGTS